MTWTVERCDGCGYMARCAELTDGTFVCIVCFYGDEDE
jgi:formylmethanofuran dehydrogenase subunit E